MTGTLHWGLAEPLDAWRSALPWPQRLLIVGPGGLGDTVLTLPALRRLQRARPQMQIAWYARGAYAPVVAMMGISDFRANDAPQALALGGFDALLSFADVGADYLGGAAQVAAVPQRIGAANARQRPRWCNQLVHTTRFGWPRHEALRYLRLLRPFGLAAPASPDELHTDCRIEATAPAALPADLPVQGHVVLHPYSAGHAREWPVAHWVALASALAGAGRPVVFTGSAAEGTRLEAAWPRAQRPAGVHDACGRLDLTQLAALLAGADAVLACSTGPLHLAAALGAPALGLYVPRKGLGLERWAPLGRAAVGVQAWPRCPTPRRCQNGACPCIEALAAPTIAKALGAGARRGIATAALSPWLVAAPPPTDPASP